MHYESLYNEDLDSQNSMQGMNAFGSGTGR